MIAGTGCGPTETRIGNLTEMVSWLGAWRASTICQFATRIVNIVGRLVVVLMIILVSRNSVCEKDARINPWRGILAVSVPHLNSR
jgi:hypothetical protein